MAVGYKNSAGVDFDLLFDPYVQGTPPAATGYRNAAGVDLAGRYAPISFGTKGPNVGMRTAAGVDVSNLWAAFGTAAYVIAGLDGKHLQADDGAVTFQLTVNANIGLIIDNDGTWTVYGGTSQGPMPQPTPQTGTWLTGGGVASDYEVQFDVFSSGSSDRVIGNGAPTWTNAGSDLSATFALPDMAADNAIERIVDGTVRIRVRRVSTGGVVSDSNISVRLSTVGYL